MNKLNKCIINLFNKNYRISKEGVIHNPENKILKGWVNTSGYLTLGIRFENDIKDVPVHRLQAYQKFGNKIFEKGIKARNKHIVWLWDAVGRKTKTR